MCDQPVTVTLNNADAGAPIPALAASGVSGAPYTISALAAPRSANPQPFEQFVFGSGMSTSSNKLEFYLGDDSADKRTVVMSLTQQELHLGDDCQIFLFYQSAVLRFAGNARFYPSDTQLPMEA